MPPLLSTLQSIHVPLHTRIVELNFRICKLFLVVSVHRTNLLLELLSLGKKCEHWMTESLDLPYRIALAIIFGNIGARITEPKLFWD